MIKMLLIMGLSLIPFTFGGTPCPPREDIYPCVCTEVPLSKKALFTVVTCRHVSHTGDMESAYKSFRHMEIDRFVMVDCFLGAQELKRNQKLPKNWWSNLRIRELEILDSELSTDFACDADVECINRYQTHVSIVNSSHKDSIDTVCEISKGKKFSWVSCLGRLKRFEFRGNKLISLEKFFPIEMIQLEELNLSRNAIKKLESEVFKNLPKLARLDLSHNEIVTIDNNVFGKEARLLKLLDLSFNHLKTLPPNVHLHTPALDTLNLRKNMFEELRHDEWEEMPKPKLRLIDFRENVINCDCYLIWFNASLHINTVVLGTCYTPEEYYNTPLRRASVVLSKLCNSTEETIIT